MCSACVCVFVWREYAVMFFIMRLLFICVCIILCIGTLSGACAHTRAEFFDRLDLVMSSKRSGRKERWEMVGGESGVKRKKERKKERNEKKININRAGSTALSVYV